MNYKFVWSVVVLRGIIAAQKILTLLLSSAGSVLIYSLLCSHSQLWTITCTIVTKNDKGYLIMIIGIGYRFET